MKLSDWLKSTLIVKLQNLLIDNLLRRTREELTRIRKLLEHIQMRSFLTISKIIDVLSIVKILRKVFIPEKKEAI